MCSWSVFRAPLREVQFQFYADLKNFLYACKRLLDVEASQAGFGKQTIQYCGRDVSAARAHPREHGAQAWCKLFARSLHRAEVPFAY